MTSILRFGPEPPENGRPDLDDLIFPDAEQTVSQR
jgi:hypothetical protein